MKKSLNAQEINVSQMIHIISGADLRPIANFD